LAGNWAPCLPPVGAKAPAQFPRRACGAWPGWRRHALGSIPELSSRLGASPQTPSPRRVRRVGAPLASVPKLPQPCWPARGGRAGARARASEASGAGDRQVERGRHTTVVDASGACGPLSPRYRRGDCVSWKWVPSRVRAPKGSPTLAHPLPLGSQPSAGRTAVGLLASADHVRLQAVHLAGETARTPHYDHYATRPPLPFRRPGAPTPSRLHSRFGRAAPGLRWGARAAPLPKGALACRLPRSTTARSPTGRRSS